MWPALTLLPVGAIKFGHLLISNVEDAAMVMPAPKIISFVAFYALVLLAHSFAAVQMLPASGEMQPGTTLEFRFDGAMVASNQLGPAAEAPVVFEPELAGTFTWLSTRSGVFAPRGPLPLGGRWTVRLRSGLTSVEGKSLEASWSAALVTPPFGVTAVSNGVWNDKEVPPDVRVMLAFQLPVKADAEYFRFLSEDGREVAASVRHADEEDDFIVGGGDEDWNTRWQLLRDPTAKIGREDFPAQLVATPSTLLPAGSGWKLVVKPGLSAESDPIKLVEPFEVALGTVPPFVLKTSEAANYINSGPALNLVFSSVLAPDITPENAGKFFRISPEPPGLAWEVDYDTVTARGKFELGRDYTLTLHDGVCSAVGQPLDGERSLVVRFAPVLPRLYLPELTMSQILGGRRMLPVRSVNLASIRAKATLLSLEETAKALSVFEEHRWKYDNEEPVPLPKLQGRVLCNEVIVPNETGLDHRQTFEMDWNRLLGGKKAGAVLIEVQGEPLPGAVPQKPAAQALLQLTDFGILWKKTDGAIRAHIFSTATATPISKASARLLDEKFHVVASGKTDAEGNASLTYQAAPAWLAVQSGSDAYVLRMGPRADTLPMGKDWFSPNWEPGKGTLFFRAMLFTDRPLYQPGEMAHVKGFVRRVQDGMFAVAGGQKITLVLNNPESNEVSRQDVTTDAQGAFDVDILIPSGPLGEFSMQLMAEGDDPVGRASFLVAEYQPDAFELTVDMPSNFPAGSPLPQATVDGKYFFGGRLTDADVRWTLRYVREAFEPEGFGEFQFIGSDEEDARPLTLRGEAKIASGQPLRIQPVLPESEAAPSRGVLAVEVTDLNQQTVSGKAQFTRQASDFYLGIAHGEDRVIRLGEEIPVQVVAVKPEGLPLADPVETTVEIEHWRYHVVRTQSAGGAVAFRHETIKEPVEQKKAMTVIPVKTSGGWSAGKQESMRFKPSMIGRYQVRVTSRDAGGRKVSSETPFYVSGEGEMAWDYRNPWGITLVPDKASYQPGETARILVQTPVSGRAFVSVERGDTILRSMQPDLSGNAPVLELPLGENDAPNITVSLVILRGADDSPRKIPSPDFRFGSCDLKVERPDARLHVEVSPERPKAQPGEEVSVNISVTAHDARPVAEAGVTFYAVDDGVLALTGFKRPDPADVFLAPVVNRVLIGLSLAQLLPEDPEDITFGNKGYLIGGGGEEGPVSLRRNFPGTACWLPSLVTDAQGRVNVHFTAPDALTRYRLVAVAVSGPLASGSGESGVTITRPLMILPALGQFANVGDKLTARAVIRNETGSDGTVEVVLKTPSGENRTSLEVPTGASQAVDFPLTFLEPGTANLEWSATLQTKGTSFRDRVQTALPVYSPMVKLHETYFTKLSGKTNNLLDGVNPQLSEGRGTVDVTVANTRLAGLGEKARFLAEYPYGCVEQTSSALVPWLVMPSLGSLLPRFAHGPEETRRVVEETVRKLLEFQTADGGLAFWKGGRQSAFFPSAWTAIVLSRAAAQGVKMPEAWGKLLDYLARSLRGLDKDADAPSLSGKAYAAYALALAGRAEASYHEELFRRKVALSADARSVLALAILQVNGPRDMVAKLLSSDQSAPEDFSPFGDPARNRAIRLLAWTHFQPDNAEVARLLAEVLALGPRQGSETTQSSAWTLLALADYHDQVETHGRTSREVRGTVVSGEDAAPFAVNSEKPIFIKTFPRHPQDPPQILTVENPAAAPLYSEIRFSIQPPLGDQPRQDRGFAVSRSYRKIAADGSLQPAKNLRVGDRVVVTLRVEAKQPSWFVALDDPLPSILEAVNPDFVSRDVAGASAETPWIVSHREIRSDRVLYFCDAMPPGAHTFTYLARVRMAGEAAAAATRAEAMYRPELFGLAEISHLSSQPAEAP